MPSYDFLNLAPNEFEDISRDLLQKHLHATFESFTNGRDNGIDLRYASAGQNIIVQCKRYKEYTDLIKTLKTEVSKVKQLNPSRYILTTTVGLTPNQKNNIIELLNPFIDNTSDIYGRDDLNNLLGMYKEIERKHLKLWLSSTNVLERILNSKIYNQSDFESQDIKECIKFYVENKSFENALEIIRKYKYVIISGLPGIGKTTLARILVCHFLALGFEEFVFVSDSINEAYSLYNENAKQIFLFDDFLGRNFLEKKLHNNEESRIVSFLKKVNNSKNKIIILTTREYILTQAKQHYDAFDNPTLQFVKCVVALENYTDLIKAKILYNHIYFSNLPEEYIDNILSSKVYTKITKHKNYNPRIIEVITSNDIWKSISPKDFPEKVLRFLDYPQSVWLHAYENQIKKLSQCILVNIMAVGTPLIYEDLKSIMESFSRKNSVKYNIFFTDLELRKSIHELENTFIITKTKADNKIIIDYQNPSIQDFLVNYINENMDYVEDIIESAISFNQLFRIFSFSEHNRTEGTANKDENTVQLKMEQYGRLVEKVCRDYDQLIWFTVVPDIKNSTRNKLWTKKYYSSYEKLNYIANNIDFEVYPKVLELLLNKFNEILIPNNLDKGDLWAYVDIFTTLKEYISFDAEVIAISFLNSINQLEDISEFEKLGLQFQDFFAEFIKGEVFEEKLGQLIRMTSEKATEDDNLIEILKNVEQISIKYNIYSDYERSIIEDKLELKRGDYDDYDEDYNYNPRKRINMIPSDEKSKTYSQQDDIENMFESLRKNKDKL